MTEPMPTPSLPKAADTILAGGGEMGARMRAHDWAASPLGPPEAWPQSLRTIVDLMLGARQAMFVAWGPELAFLYNDDYAPIFGAKHPDALGRPFAEVWSDIWEQISPLVERTLAGEASWHEDLLIPMERNGYPEEAWFSFSYTPVRDESGTVAGMFCAATETTDKVLADRRLAFRVAFDGRLRDLADPKEVMAAAAEALGRQLGAAQAGYAEADGTAEHVVIERDWNDGGMPSIVGIYRLDDYGPEFAADLRRGRTIVVGDVEKDARTSSPQALAAYAANSVRAYLNVPLVKAGRLVALLFVHDPEPRTWREADVALAQEVAERTWSAVERARAEDALRKSEERFQLALEASGLVGLWDWDLPNDLVYADARFAELYSVDPARAAMGAPITDFIEGIHPEDRRPVGRAIQQAIETAGEFAREYRLVQPDGSVRWVFARGRCYHDANGTPARFPGVSVDITERKQGEEHLRLMMNELNHRVKNTLATVQSIAMQTFKDTGKGAAEGRERREAFESRLIALSKAHDVLTRENWQGAGLRDIARAAVTPFMSAPQGAFTFEGPDRRLNPKMALALAMALHELATNAVKYGALSAPAGRVRLSWTVAQKPVGERLCLTWEERFGPPVAPPTRKGFGSRLVERQLAGELGGDVRLDFQPDGLVCSIEAPLQHPGSLAPSSARRAWVA